MQMSGARILCHYLLLPPGTFIPQPGYFLCPLSISMPFGVLAFALCFQALWILLIFTNDNVLDWLVKIRLYSVSWVDVHCIFHFSCLQNSLGISCPREATRMPLLLCRLPSYSLFSYNSFNSSILSWAQTISYLAWKIRKGCLFPLTLHMLVDMWVSSLLKLLRS